MSLIKCNECGTEISSKASACPKCGAKIKRTSMFTKLVAVFIVATILIAVFQGSSEKQSSQSPVLTPAQKAENAKQDEYVKRAALGAIMLKKSMRNPDSFKLDSALVIDKTGAVCYDYRAQNGFGGINIGHAVLSGKTFKTSEMSGFEQIWNRDCANKAGHETSASINWFAL